MFLVQVHVVSIHLYFVSPGNVKTKIICQKMWVYSKEESNI